MSSFCTGKIISRYLHAFIKVEINDSGGPNNKIFYEFLVINIYFYLLYIIIYFNCEILIRMFYNKNSFNYNKRVVNWKLYFVSSFCTDKQATPHVAEKIVLVFKTWHRQRQVYVWSRSNKVLNIK